MDTFRLGDWHIQPNANRASKNGHTVQVRAKVMDLLVFLAQCPGEVVSKDALLNGVWGTESVSESALTRSMTELRQALEDDAERPTVIETIPKRGYRLLVPVERLAPTVPEATQPSPVVADSNGNEDALSQANSGRQSKPSTSTPGRFVWGLGGLIVGVAAAYVAIATWPLRSQPADSSGVRFTVPPPEGTTFAALPTDPQPAVSPDGRRIVTVAVAKNARRSLWLHTLDSVAPQPLADTQGAARPFWSPDGRWIGFFAHGKLKKVRVSGESPETLCDAAEGSGGAWSRRGVVLFAPNRASGLYAVSESGGTPVPVTRLDESHGETSHRFPHFLPDGRHFLFLVVGGQPQHRGVYVGSIDSTERKWLGGIDSNAIFVEPGYLLYVREAALMAHPFDLGKLELTGAAVPIAQGLIPAPSLRLAPFAATSNVLVYRPGGMVKTRLVWTDREGKALGSVGSPARYISPSLSSDGKRLAVDVLDHPTGQIDTWLFDLERNVSTRLTFGPSLQGSPVWAPDGRRLALASNRRGVWNLYERDIDEYAPGDATSDRVLVESESDKYPQAWSPDGQSLVYVSRTQGTGDDLWLLPMSGKRTPVPLIQTPFRETEAQVSPDGRWLAYASDETGRFEVYVRPFASSGGKWRVSSDGGCQPRWRMDGKELFYMNYDRVMAVPIQSDSSLKPGPASQLFTIGVGRTDDVTWEYAPAPDGRRFLFKEPVFEHGGNPMTVVLTWQALLAH